MENIKKNCFIIPYIYFPDTYISIKKDKRANFIHNKKFYKINTIFQFAFKIKIIFVNISLIKSAIFYNKAANSSIYIKLYFIFH